MMNVLTLWICVLFVSFHGPVDSLEIQKGGLNRNYRNRICRLRCRAACTTLDTKTASGSGHPFKLKKDDACFKNCRKNLEKDWMKRCETKDCIESCNFTIKDPGRAPKSPYGLKVIKDAHGDAELTFNVDNTHQDYIMYIIEKLPSQKKLYYAFHLPIGTYKMNFPIHGCKESSLRLMAVTRYGYSNFSEAWIGHFDPVRPGPITNVQIKQPEYLDYDFKVEVTWDLPKGWKYKDISKPLVKFNTEFCSLSPWLPNPIVEIKERTRKPMMVLSLKGLYCSYTGEIRLLSKCGKVGEPYKFVINFTDCEEKYPNLGCPSKPPFTADGITRGKAIPLNHIEFGLYELRWDPPDNLGNNQLAYYVVDWGKIEVSNIVKIISIVSPSEGKVKLSGNVTSFRVKVKEPWEKYGFRVGPIETEKRYNSLTGMGLFMLHRFPPPDDEIVEAWNYVNSTGVEEGVSVFRATKDRWLSIRMSGNKTISGRFQTGNRTYYYKPDNGRPLAHHMSLPQNLAIYIAVPAVLLLLTLSAVVYGIRQRQKFSHLEHHQSIGDAESYNLYNSVRPHDDSPPPTPSRIVDKWEIHPRHLFFGDVLGTGAFGQVYQAMLKLYPEVAERSDTIPLFAQEWDHDTIEMIVAVKQLKEYADKTQKQEFLNEIKLMKTLGSHLNVVSMVGCITINEPLCLIVEQLPNGDMLHYLRKHREFIQQGAHEDYYENACKLTYLDLLSFARQIARGMEFLSQKGFVHRDLATRNILVGEERTVKIGDFGLTRYVYDDKVYVNRKGGKLPLKWMSIEAIFDLTFSTASDVWAFGVVLFEIVTLGGTPYPAISNQDLLKFLKQGYRMEKPDNCDDELYGIMYDCWAHNAEDRPNFTELIIRLDSMLERYSTSDYLDITLDEARDYYRCQNNSDDEDDETDGDGEDPDDEVAQHRDNNSHMSRLSVWSGSSTLTGRSVDSDDHCSPSKRLLTKAESISPGSSGRESMEAKDDDEDMDVDGSEKPGIVYTQVITRASRPSSNTHDSGNVSFEMEMDLNSNGPESTQYLIPKAVIDEGTGAAKCTNWEDAFV